MTGYDLLALALLVSTLAPFAACALRYGLRSRWRDSTVGRVLMLLLAAICAVLVLNIAARGFGPDNHVVWVLRVVTLGAAQVAGWRLYRQIARYQRAHPAPTRSTTTGGTS